MSTEPLELLHRDYSPAFEGSLRQFLEPRGGDRWLPLHGNGPASRMARFERETRPEIERHAGSIAGQRVLDFGCGTGTITPSLAVRAGEVVGFDINADALAVTRARLDEHGLASVRLVEAARYADVADELGSFDLVLMHAVLEHVPLSIAGRRAAVLLEAFDALRPGGHLVIVESPNRLWPRDIYCTGLWGLPWTRSGSAWSYRRAVRRGRHRDPAGRDPVTLEERGAWGFTYWAVRRYLRPRQLEVVNLQRGHARWVRYNRQLSLRRRAFETLVHYGLTRTVHVPVVALSPMLSPLVIRRVR